MKSNPETKEFKKPSESVTVKAPEPLSPNESINGNMDAVPKSTPQVNDDTIHNADLAGATEGIQVGEANERDARELGYTDRHGHAVDMAKKDVEGRPTGAFTDIGAGRSSVVKRAEDADINVAH